MLGRLANIKGVGGCLGLPDAIGFRRGRQVSRGSLSSPWQRGSLSFSAKSIRAGTGPLRRQ
jgi:hypothetical protein